MSKDFFNIEDILNNNGNNDRDRSRASSNNGPNFNNASKNNSYKSKQQYNPSNRYYPDFDLEKSKAKNPSVKGLNKGSNNSRFNNFDLEEMKGKKFDFDNSRNSNTNSTRNNSNYRNADIYIMDQEVSSEFISAIEDNKKKFSDPKPRKGRKLYGDGLYSSQELEKAPELVKITPVAEQKTKNKKTFKNKRSSYLIFSVIVIFIFFITLIFLLLNQSRVMQVSYENAAIKSQIAYLEKDNAERIERLAREADLNEIAKKAASNGFQIPNRQQRVEVKDDKLDQITYFDENNNAIGIVTEEVDMDLVFSNIEKYILEKEESLAQSKEQVEAKANKAGDTKVEDEIEGGDNAE